MAIMPAMAVRCFCPYGFRRQPQIFRSESHIFFDDRCHDLIIRILKHHTYMLPDLIQLFFVTGIDAGNPHFAAGGQQNGIHMFRQRRLAAAVVPQDCHKRACFQCQSQIFQDFRRSWFSLLVGIVK